MGRKKGTPAQELARDPKALAKEVGRRVRRWRQATPPPKDRRQPGGKGQWKDHLTIDELATLAQVSPAVINRIELGHVVPALSTLLLLAAAFNCAPGELLPSDAPSSGAAEMASRVAAKVSRLNPRDAQLVLNYADSVARRTSTV